MKEKKVEWVKTHVSIGMIAGSQLTIESKKHCTEMVLTPVGVRLVTKDKGEEYLIPFTNITHVKMFKEQP